MEARLSEDQQKLFDEFWAMFPRRVAKQDARKAWAKIGADAETLQMIRTALAWQVGQWRDPQYIPYPATYLNGRRWEDEPDAKVVLPASKRSQRWVPDGMGGMVELG